ncbi:hypothetical protein IAT40_003896 [Kwoniella sp. CBS 6097]
MSGIPTPNPNQRSESESDLYDISKYNRALHDNILLNPLYELRQTLASIAFGITSSRILLNQSFPISESDLDSVRKESKVLGRTSERVVGRAEIDCKDHEGVVVGVKLDASGWTIESIRSSASNSTSTKAVASTPEPQLSSLPIPAQLQADQPETTTTTATAEPSLPSWMRHTSASVSSSGAPNPDSASVPVIPSDTTSTSTSTMPMKNQDKIGRTYETLEALMIDISPAYSVAMNDEIWKRFGMNPQEQGQKVDDNVDIDDAT